jgi:hypothetical protein
MKNYLKTIVISLVVISSLGCPLIAFASGVTQTDEQSEFELLQADIAIINGLSENEIQEFASGNQEWLEELNTRIETYLADFPESQKDTILIELRGDNPRLRSMSDYFNSHEYHYRNGYWTYSMLPKLSTRLLWVYAEAGWNELVSAYTIGSTYYNSLFDQYQCHFDLFVEADWDIEKGRTDVSYAATLLALCNPDASGSYDD